MIQDMTRGRPFGLLLRFALPLLVGNIFQLCYGIADTAIVGRVLGAEALAAVGATTALQFLPFGLFFGLTSGLTIVTAQRFGAGDHDGVRHSVAMSAYIATALTAICSLVFVFGARWMLQLLHTPQSIFPEAEQYLTLILGGSCSLVFYVMLSSILRALGDSVTPLYFLIFSCLVNIGLDYWFLTSFGWGVRGAAAATVISQALSGGLCLLLIRRKFPILRMRKRDWRWDWPFICEHLRIALPMALQFSIMALGSIVLQFKLNDFGTEAIASYTASLRLDQIVLQPMLSVGVAMGTFTAQNYGAGRYGRIYQGFSAAFRMELYFALAAGFVFLLFGNSFIRIFLEHPSEEIVNDVRLYILTAAGMYWALGVLQVYRHALQGMGHAVAPMLSGIIEMALRMGAALFLSMPFGYWGICLANPLAWLGATLQLGIVYHIVIHRLRKRHRAVAEGRMGMFQGD